MTSGEYPVEALLLCLVAGAVLGLLFLALKVLKIVLGIKKLGEAVLDIIFCAVCAMNAFICALAIDNGRIRLFEILAMFAGLFAVIVTLDPFVGAAARGVYIIVKKISAFICKKSKAVAGKILPKDKKSGKKPKNRKNKSKKIKKRLANFM